MTVTQASPGGDASITIERNGELETFPSFAAMVEPRQPDGSYIHEDEDWFRDIVLEVAEKLGAEFKEAAYVRFEDEQRGDRFTEISPGDCPMTVRLLFDNESQLGLQVYQTKDGILYAREFDIDGLTSRHGHPVEVWDCFNTIEDFKDSGFFDSEEIRRVELAIRRYGSGWETLSKRP